MAKDPAFLFYPGDWLGGTMTFSRSHKGAYMDLLMAQFNNGHMSISDIEMILGGDFVTMWESKLKIKFKKDDNGLYFNQKLENEVIKRRKFTDSRRKNLSGTSDNNSHMESHMVIHKENENENENIVEDKVKKSKISKKEKVANLPEETRPHPFLDHIKENVPHLLKMEYPLTYDQAVRLHNDFGKVVVIEFIDKIANKPDVLTKYSSLNLTIRNWIKRESSFAKNGGGVASPVIKSKNYLNNP